jgi:hypothetical protein
MLALALPAGGWGQEPVSSSLGPLFSQEGRASWLDGAFRSRAVTLETSQSNVVSTRRGGQLANDYGTWGRFAALDLPVTLLRRPAMIELARDSTVSSGSYYDHTDFVEGDAHFESFQASITMEISRRDYFRLRIQRERDNALLKTSYLSSTFDLFGVNPSLDWNRDLTTLALTYQRVFSTRWSLQAATAVETLGSAISVENSAGGGSLSIPAGTGGVRSRLALRHEVTKTAWIDMYGETKDASGAGLDTRETGLQVGRATSFERSRGFGSQWVRSLRNGASLRFNAESLSASTEYTGLVYNVAGAGLNAGANTLVSYDAIAKNRRAELGFSWSSAQGSRRRLDLSYRQLWNQDIAHGDYAATQFIFGTEGSSGVNYPNVRLGVLQASYELPVRSMDLRLIARQLIPFHLQDRVPGSSSGGGSSGPSSISSGGWTLGAVVSYRF